VIDLDRLFERAKAAQAHAYAPYSDFKVGAAVATAEGEVFAGCNVENAAYPIGICAEAAAISAMVAAGRRRIVAVLVLGEGEALVTPCGGCRQRIREFTAPDAPIYTADPGGVRRTFRLEELLPFAFGPDNLKPR
jgi:cytidine deaminase